MQRQPTPRYCALFAALVCGTTASADVTTQDVWDNWKGQMDIYGEGFTVGAEDMSGDTLTVSGIKIEMSDDEASLTADLGTITLTENSDGTVSVTMPSTYPMTLNLTPDFGSPSVIRGSVSQSGMILTVSGDPDAMLYEVSADVYSLSVDDLEGDAAAEVDLVIAALVMRDLQGSYAVTMGDLMDLTYGFSLGALDLDVAFSETEGSGAIQATADIAELNASADLTIPQNMDLEADVPPFAEGLGGAIGYAFGDLSYSLDVNADGEALSGQVTASGGQLDVAIDMDGVSYVGETRDINVNLLVPNEFPFPIEASMVKGGYDIQIPLSQGDGGPRDARIAFNITELAIGEILWSLGDPQGILPRDPITVALGIDAKVTPFFDFLDPEQMQAAAMSDIPGEINSAVLSDLTIRAAGAEITGNGAFTFDNSDLQTFDGLPRPEGEVNFAINGVNGLVDRLIQMGLIPEEQAMMPRMMLGMFATPVGDDMLTSTIEINSEGHVLANGQRLR